MVDFVGYLDRKESSSALVIHHRKTQSGVCHLEVEKVRDYCMEFAGREKRLRLNLIKIEKRQSSSLMRIEKNE